MRQDETVIQTLEKLGGIATLGRLYQEILKKCDWKTKTPQASIRRIVQNNKDIYKIKPGLWALRSRQKELKDRGIIVETEKNKDSRIVQEFTHSYYQGLLVTIGNLRKLKTFVPNQDKAKMFLDEKLGDLRTLQNQPLYSYEKFTKRSSTIDVIWFNDREMPEYFFEVEHSTDFQNSLNKFSDLQDFFVKMYIVADEKRHSEYDRKLHCTVYDNIRERVKFLSYENLGKQYAFELESQRGIFIR